MSWLLNNSVDCTFEYEIKLFCSAFKFQAEKEVTYLFLSNLPFMYIEVEV